MKKSIIMVLVFCTGMLIAQDIAGTYRAGGQRVEYQFYARPNYHLDSQTSNPDNQFGTELVINDIWGLGIGSTIADIPAGYNFAEKIVGPIGLVDMNALQYFLYVTFDEGGDVTGGVGSSTGRISDSQVLASETDTCVTEVQLLPLDDEFVFSTDMNASETVQSTMVGGGHPNVSPYAGQTAGTWAIDESSFFSFFPLYPAEVDAEFSIFGDSFGACFLGNGAPGDEDYLPSCTDAGGWAPFNTDLTPEQCAGAGSSYVPGLGCIMGNAQGGAPGSDEAAAYCATFCGQYMHGVNVGGQSVVPYGSTTAGYVIENPESSFAPNNVLQNEVPDLHVEWHYIDGSVAETGLGDDVLLDEDGDGTIHDNILGYPDIMSTYVSIGCGFNYPIMGDVRAILEDQGMGSCISYNVNAGDSVEEGDDYDEGTNGANEFYVMLPDYANWGGFLTWNAVMYGQTGDAAFLANDSASDFDPAATTYVDTDGDGVPDTPLNTAGGRLVMGFEATCIPVVTSISVLGELFSVGCAGYDGDIDGNGSVDVLDVVAVVNAVLTNNTDVSEIGCADVNFDGAVNVLDVVEMVTAILNPSSDDRASSATKATFNKSENEMTMTTDGNVNAVQIKLSHDSNFSIELTKDAFVSEYHTSENTTTLAGRTFNY